jgi:hypothetical protein
MICQYHLRRPLPAAVKARASSKLFLIDGGGLYEVAGRTHDYDHDLSITTAMNSEQAA